MNMYLSVGLFPWALPLTLAPNSQHGPCKHLNWCLLHSQSVLTRLSNTHHHISEMSTCCIWELIVVTLEFETTQKNIQHFVCYIFIHKSISAHNIQNVVAFLLSICVYTFSYTLGYHVTRVQCCGIFGICGIPFIWVFLSLNSCRNLHWAIAVGWLSDTNDRLPWMDIHQHIL